MQPGHERWTDSRLDDRFRGLDERINDIANEIRATRDLPKAVAEMAVQMKYIGNGIQDCLHAQEKLDARFEGYVKEQDTLRRGTFRWVVGAVLTATGLVLMTVSVLIGKF